MKVLVVMKVLDEHKEWLEEANPSGVTVFKANSDVTKEDVQDADIIVGNVAPELLKYCENLKLLQLNSAGTDGYTTAGVLPEGCLLANATGSYGLAIAEHMIGSLLFLMKKFDLYYQNQKNHLWKDEGSVTSIDGSKTLVVGLGDIGSEFAIRMHALGSEVTGIKRVKTNKPDYIKEIYTMDHLYACLEEADIVATSLPGTASTYQIFNAEAFKHMKNTAYFLNVGRGNAVDTEALYEALKNHIIKGAMIDVADPEPIPSSHPIWDLDNVFITPHVSGGFHLQKTHDKIIKIAVANIIHANKQEPFENLVDMATGYRQTKM